MLHLTREKRYGIPRASCLSKQNLMKLKGNILHLNTFISDKFYFKVVFIIGDRFFYMWVNCSNSNAIRTQMDQHISYNLNNIELPKYYLQKKNFCC